MNAPDSLKRHPLSAYFGDLPPNEFTELVTDIGKNGVLQPIVVQGDEVLDGWSRYSAAKEALQLCPMVEFDSLGTGMTPEAFVASQNFYRRHLSSTQRAAMAVEIFGDRMMTKSDVARRNNAVRYGHLDKIEVGKLTVEQVAKIARTSDSDIAVAKMLKRQRPDLFAKVKRGELSPTQTRRTKSAQSKTAIDRARRANEAHRTAMRAVTSPATALTESELTPAEFARHWKAWEDRSGADIKGDLLADVKAAAAYLAKCAKACGK